MSNKQMAKKQTMYLETSVISAYFDFWKSDFNQKKYTRIFWKNTLPSYTMAISEVVLAEIDLHRNAVWRSKMLALIGEFTLIKASKKVESIAKAYIAAQLFPQSEYRDALHAAYASGSRADYLVSWNQRHITRPFKRRQIMEYNLKMGLGNPTIVSPLDFLESISTRL